MLFEDLESRQLYSTAYSLDASGTLGIWGDVIAANVITVQEDKGYLVVSAAAPDLNWKPTYSLMPLEMPLLRISPSGQASAPPPGGFKLADVKKIEIQGGPQADLITVNSSVPARIRGGDGDDVITGGFGDDSITGETGSDTIDGRAGNDTVTGGDTVFAIAGNDTVRGGAGDDLIDASWDYGADTYSGGAGRDLLTYALRQGPVRVDPTDGPPNGIGEDVVRTDIEDFTGGWGNDVIVGTAANNVINGGLGNDTLSGGPGDDIVLGADGDDSLRDDGVGTDYYDGGAGYNYMYYSSRSDDLTLTIDGVANDGAPGEHDQILSCRWIMGGSGNDLIVAGNDAPYALLGGAGNDTLVGGAQHCELSGMDGDDMLYSTNGIPDYLDGGNGNDTASIDKHCILWFAFADEKLISVECW